jgi:hypothetical protein
MDLDWMAAAYEKANAGDWSEFASHLTADYDHQVPAVGLHFTSRDEAVAGLTERYKQLNMRQTVRSVAEHGNFVVAIIDGESDAWATPYVAVHVFEVRDGKFCSFLGSYPAPTAVRAGTQAG